MARLALADLKPTRRQAASTVRSANPMLCACIQQVANMTLSGADQRLAAKFFRDPAMAQEVRQSARNRHREFWTRYTTFGQAAEQVCAE